MHRSKQHLYSITSSHRRHTLRDGCRSNSRALASVRSSKFIHGTLRGIALQCSGYVSRRTEVLKQTPSDSFASAVGFRLFRIDVNFSPPNRVADFSLIAVVIENVHEPAHITHKFGVIANNQLAHEVSYSFFHCHVTPLISVSTS